MIFRLDQRLRFPSPELADPSGLLAVGGDLRPERLVLAYGMGIFPWYGDDSPILWHSPDPRAVLPASDLQVGRSLAKTMRRGVYTVRLDTAFRAVIEGCSSAPRPGQDGTWIVPEMIDAYCEWHALGRAHSFETWIGGELVGGLYGIGLGRMFFGESMFSHRTDASKIAFAALVCFCRANRVSMIDCQQHTSHLASMGARELRRTEFEARLSRSLGEPPITDWTYDLRMWQLLADAPAEDTGP